MLTKKKVYTSILLVFGILLLVNFISNEFYIRLDFTEDQRYSLSEATENILEAVDNPVTVKAYFSEDLPPDIAKVRRDFRDMLVEYANLSDGMVVYEFINPNEEQQVEMEAQQNGIRPIMINVREKDQATQKKAYLGAVLQMGEKKEVIPFIQPGAAMEYELSSAVKKLSITDKPKIALLQGHGEPSLNEIRQLRNQLSVMYNIEEVTLSDTTSIDPSYKVALMIAPADTIPPNHLEYLDDYIASGGRLLLALNRVDGDLQNARGKSVYTGMSDWLKEKGIEIEENFVIDINCSNIMVRQQQGSFVMNTPVRFPYLPIITNFNDHPVTEGLEQVMFLFASPLNFTAQDTSTKFTPLALTSEKSGLENANTFFNIDKEWGATDFNLSNLPIAAAIEGNIDGNRNSRMIVVGDGDFVVNGSGQRAQQVNEDNINLASNAVDWLADDTGLIQLRTKAVTGRPIDQTLEEGTKTFLKYLNFLLPILIIIIYGIFRAQVKRKLRTKLMNVDYV